MKKLLTIALAAFAVYAVQAANPGLRMNVNGIKSKITLTPEEDGFMNISRMTWLAENIRPYTLVYDADNTLSGDWEESEITFTPGKGGRVEIALSGQWAKDRNNRKWVVIENIKCNGKMVRNGNFAKLGTASKRPLYFTFNNKAKFLAAGGKDGKGALLVNHDNTVSFIVPVKANVPCKITLEARAATAEEVQ